MSSLYCTVAMIMSIMASTHAFGFSPTITTTTIRPIIPKKLRNSRQSSFLFSSSNENNNNDMTTTQLQEKARVARLEAEKLETSYIMDKIDILLKRLEGGKGVTTDALSDRKEIQNQVLDLAKRIDPDFASSIQTKLGIATTSTTTSNGGVDEDDGPTLEILFEEDKQTKPLPQGLTLDEVEAAKAYLETLPKPVQDTFAKAASLDENLKNPYLNEWDEVIFKTDLVITLYEQRYALTPALLQTLYKESLVTKNQIQEEGDLDKEEIQQEIYSILGNDITIVEVDEEQTKRDALVEGLFPRTLRKEDDFGNIIAPTSADLSIFLDAVAETKAFTIDTSVSSSPDGADEITGGYIIRGTNNKESSQELISTLDAALPDTWKDKYQFSYVKDFLLNDINEPPLILLTTKDFKPTVSGLFTNAVSFSSLIIGFTWAVDTFRYNKIVVEKLREANDLVVAGSSEVDISWFTDELLMVLGPMVLIQAAHELAHIVVAWKDKIKVTPPTILPSQTLPILSFENKLKNSPPSFSSLYDFAMAGPAVGLSLSIITLCLGLQLTTTMDVEASQYFPGLPISFLQVSGLGYTIVDTFLDGNGVLLTKDPSTIIPMHPFAIAGFVSLLINALDLLPIGSTDGGRIAQTVFGRFWGHFFIGGAAFLSLIILMFTSDTQNLFFSYLLITSFTQRDGEVPCRDEVEKIGNVRLAVAFVAWFGAILALLPSV